MKKIFEMPEVGILTLNVKDVIMDSEDIWDNETPEW